jgi:hypothetical protein
MMQSVLIFIESSSYSKENLTLRNKIMYQQFKLKDLLSSNCMKVFKV